MRREQTFICYIIQYLIYFLYNTIETTHLVSAKTEFTTEISCETEKYIFEKDLHVIRKVSTCKQFVKESPSKVTFACSPQFYLNLTMN